MPGAREPQLLRPIRSTRLSPRKGGAAPRRAARRQIAAGWIAELSLRSQLLMGRNLDQLLLCSLDGGSAKTHCPSHTCSPMIRRRTGYIYKSRTVNRTDHVLKARTNHGLHTDRYPARCNSRHLRATITTQYQPRQRAYKELKGFPQEIASIHQLVRRSVNSILSRRTHACRIASHKAFCGASG